MSEQIEQAIVHWKKLADEQLELAEINKRYGDVSTFHKRHDVYTRTVKALKIQLETGIAVCSCCFKPFTSDESHS